ncbi:MAG: peptidylprolyl isomerase [Gemmataceae bacterium]
MPRYVPMLAALLFALPAVADDKAKPVAVVIATDLGDIEVELDAAKAPNTVANFLKYVDAKAYDGGRFHRTVTPDNQPQNKVKIEVIQGGVHPDKAKDDLAPVKLERTKDTGLAHKDGTISMARAEPDTATSDFFICVGNQPELDFDGKRNPDGQGFAAFGRVTKGMDVVKKIQQAKADGQKLTPPVFGIRRSASPRRRRRCSPTRGRAGCRGSTTRSSAPRSASCPKPCRRRCPRPRRS